VNQVICGTDNVRSVYRKLGLPRATFAAAISRYAPSALSLIPDALQLPRLSMRVRSGGASVLSTRSVARRSAA
jgi:hypothetical protein